MITDAFMMLGGMSATAFSSIFPTYSMPIIPQITQAVAWAVNSALILDPFVPVREVFILLRYGIQFEVLIWTFKAVVWLANLAPFYSTMQVTDAGAGIDIDSHAYGTPHGYKRFIKRSRY